MEETKTYSRTRMNIMKESIQQFKTYKESVKDLHKSKLGKNLNEILEIDNEIEKLRLQQRINVVSNDKERLLHTQNRILENQNINKEKSLSSLKMDTQMRDFKKSTSSKYENVLDKKIRELDESLKVEGSEDFNSGDIVSLMILGNLKIIMDGLKEAKNLGIILTKAYIQHSYKDSLMKAEDIENIFNGLEQMEEQQSSLLEKGIVIENPIEDTKKLVFDIAKDLNTKLLDTLENSDGVKSIVSEYKDKESKLETSIEKTILGNIQSVVSEYKKDIESFLKKEKLENKNEEQNLHRQ